MYLPVLKRYAKNEKYVKILNVFILFTLQTDATNEEARR